MDALDHFNVAIGRAEHLLSLYDLLHDTRSRGVRKDWSQKFNDIMHWPKDERFVRIDGREQDSILIMRERVGIDRSHFAHELLSELLRSSVVASVSALDRYMHDLIVNHSWSILSGKVSSIPKELSKLSIPVLATKNALEQLRANQKARPGNLVKTALQEQLHREFTFQNPDDILLASKMLGLKNFWTNVASELNGKPKSEDVIDKLREIARRRNQIVHEADLVRKTKAKQVTVRDISRDTAEQWTNWIKDFVAAIQRVVDNSR